jgi:hypothetical protein
MKISGKDILGRLSGVIGFILIYFYIIRPMRAIFSQKIIYEGLMSAQTTIGNIIFIEHGQREVKINFLNNGSEIVLSHIPQLGFFFLLGAIGLIVFNASRRTYYCLILFQVIVEIIVIILFWLGIHYTTFGFMVSDFLMNYISPLGCLGFVVYVSGRGEVS